MRGLSREDREILDEAKRKRVELLDLRASPEKYVQMTDEGWTNYDKGIINDYSDVTEVSVRNASSFDVDGIEGEFTFLGMNGEVLAKLPVTLEGEVLAGRTKLLKADGRTIQGKAAGGRFVVTSLRVHE